jgi:hypothetical protein
MGDLINNRAYPNIDAAAGASVRGWITALETIAAEFANDTLYIFGHAAAGQAITGARADLLFQRDYFQAVQETAARARQDGRSRDETIRLTLPNFNFGTDTARLALALGIAYDEAGQ